MPNNSLGIILIVLALAAACGTNTTGLDDPPDASGGSSAGGAGGLPPCPKNLPDKANWPGGFTATSCRKPCGPDGVGSRTCSQTNKSECDRSGGCVCRKSTDAEPEEVPCSACSDCSFSNLPICYQPTAPAAPTDCADGVEAGAACSPACGRRLCLRADGRTGCVCNDQGKYTCATWGGTTWK